MKNRGALACARSWLSERGSRNRGPSPQVVRKSGQEPSGEPGEPRRGAQTQGKANQ